MKSVEDKTWDIFKFISKATGNKNVVRRILKLRNGERVGRVACAVFMDAILST